MGGRCAEKLIFKDFTTGASNDISVATDIAKNMVTQWGMSKTIGPLHFKTGSDEVFLGREIASGRDFSDELSARIDREVTDLVKNAEENADRILSDNIEILHNVAKTLLDRETITGEEMIQIIKKGSLDLPDDTKQEQERPPRRRSKKTPKK